MARADMPQPNDRHGWTIGAVRPKVDVIM